MAAKYLNVVLIDGNQNGWISCECDESPVVVYRIPKEQLEQHSNDDDENGETRFISNSGIYILVGDNGYTYVGQSSTRDSGDSFRARLADHSRNEKKDFWSVALAITKTAVDVNDAYDSADLDYLENKFIAEIKNSPKYSDANTNKQSKDPKTINAAPAKRHHRDLEFEAAKLYIHMLGYDLFDETTSSPMIATSKKNASAGETKPKAEISGGIKKEEAEHKKKTYTMPISYTFNGADYNFAPSEGTWRKILDNVIEALADIDFDLLYSLAEQNFMFPGKGAKTPLLTLDKKLIEHRNPREIKNGNRTIYYNSNLNNSVEQKFIKMLIEEYNKEGLVSDTEFNVVTIPKSSSD